MNKRYEILEMLPSYGPMYIPIAENNQAFYSDEGFVVRFYRLDGTNWIGNFKGGSQNNSNEIYEFKNSPNLLIISCGCCYVINPESIKPVSVFNAWYSKVFETKKGRIILQDVGDFFVVYSDGNYKYTEIYTSEDLTNLKLVNNIFQSLAFYPRQDADDWIDFTFNVS